MRALLVAGCLLASPSLAQWRAAAGGPITATTDDLKRLGARLDRALTELRDEQARLRHELEGVSSTVGQGADGGLSEAELTRVTELSARLEALDANSMAMTKAIAGGLNPELVAAPLAKVDTETAEVRRALGELQAKAQVKPPDLMQLVERLNARVAELEARPALPPPPAEPVAQPTQEAPASAQPTVPWYTRLKVEGVAEAYYSYRFQGTPGDKTNELRAFDTYNNTMTPSFGKVGVSLAPAPAGFRIDLAFGPTADLGAPDLGSPGAEVFKHLLQAYASVKLFDRLTFDFGKFVTSAGAEVFENNVNWLSTRSMIFAYGPYTHSGLRVGFQVNELLTIQAGVVNGWDNIVTANSWKTFNVSAFVTLPTTTAALTFYGGPQSNPNVRVLLDAVVTQKFTEGFSMNLNAVFGTEGLQKWYAGALMAQVKLGDHVRLSSRVELFADPDGHRTGFKDTSFLNSTVGAAFVLANPEGFGAVELRPEFRHDQALRAQMFTSGSGGGGSLQPVVQRDEPGSPFVGGTSDGQTTVSVTMVASF